MKNAVLAIAGASWLLAPVVRALDDEPVEDLEGLASKYSILIVTKDEPFPVSTFYGAVNGLDASDRKIRSYERILVAEFGIYPVTLVRRTGLKRIVLCTNLIYRGEKRTALPDLEHRTLYLDVARGRYSKTYVRQVIHHEFFHMIDWKDDRKIYIDDVWSSLNPKNFSYGKGGRFAQDDNTMAAITDKYPGFLTKYSTTGVEEDKAEVFAHMLIHPFEVEKRAEEDEILRSKTERMGSLLKNFCPEVDENFWKGVQELRRDKRVGNR